MTVFVDDLRCVAHVGRRTARWSHLFADDLDELHRFAGRLGLRRAWFQDRPGFPHYDVTDPMRAKAIAAGAEPIPRGELVALLDRIRERW